jgi:transposase-like protein
LPILPKGVSISLSLPQYVGVMEETSHPVGGVDYPRTLAEFDAWFSWERDCEEYLRRLRWPRGFECPACGAAGGWQTGRGLLRCSICGRQTSTTAGTLFEGTRKPLRLWFQAIWYFTNQKHGVSALGLQRVLGLGSYQTAWAWLHRLRRAMVRPDRDRLSGEVEVDETFLGSPSIETDGRGTDKTLIVIAAEVRGRGTGRIRMACIGDASAASLIPFVKSAVREGTVVRTDGWKGYGPLPRYGYTHRPTSQRGTRIPAHVAMPRVHRVASLLKRWWLGTYHGGISERHLEYYLDEFTFRFNRRTSRTRGLLFYRLLQQAVHMDAMPYTQLRSHTPAGSG